MIRTPAELFPIRPPDDVTAAPLLVFRLTQLPQIAWTQGRAAARRVEEQYIAGITALIPQLLRHGDLIAHEVGSGEVLIVLASASRSGMRVVPSDARSILERIASAVKSAIAHDIERGWIMVERAPEVHELPHLVTRALERGAQERERFAFFSTIGHELRTPMTAIRGYLETLLDDQLPQPLQRRFLEIAHAETLRAGRLLDGMFDISLLDLGKDVTVARTTFNVACQDALTAMSAALRARAVRLELGVIADESVAMHRDRLAQVLINIIDNAVKHGRPGGRIRLTTTVEEKRFLLCSITDDGPGIKPELHDSIFALGERGRTTATGSGIGLAVVRLLLERAGGWASCRSPQPTAMNPTGLGLEVRFAVPLAEPQSLGSAVPVGATVAA